MKTEKNENEPTASEVLQGFDFRLKTDSPPRIRHSRFTQKRIEEATKQINLVMKGFEGDSMMLQDTIDDLRKELEIQKNYAQDLSNWIKKADEIYWAKHKACSTMHSQKRH